MSEQDDNASRPGKHRERVSFWKVDALHDGSMPAEIADRFRESLGRDREGAIEYLASQARLKSEVPVEKTLRTIRSAGRRTWMDWLPIKRPGESSSRPAEWKSVGSPRAWALGASLAGLVLSISFWLPRPSTPGEGSGTLAKGAGVAEFRVLSGKERFQAGEWIRAGSGDTLAFEIRNLDSSHVQVWTREEGAPPEPASGPSRFILPPSLKWTTVPFRMVLTGTWTRQEIYLVESGQDMEVQEVLEAITNGETAGPFRIAVFRFVRESRDR